MNLPNAKKGCCSLDLDLKTGMLGLWKRWVKNSMSLEKEYDRLKVRLYASYVIPPVVESSRAI